MHYLLFFLFGLGIFQTNPVIAADTIKIFTYRQPALLSPILEAYTKAKGVEFQIVYAPKGLVARLQAEGKSAQADLVITTDISRVKELADSGLLAPVASQVIARNVPAHLRAADNSWTALSLRARILAVSKTRVKKVRLPKLNSWQNRNGRAVCVVVLAAMSITVPCWLR